MNQSRDIKIKLENYQNVSKQLQITYPLASLMNMVIFTQCKFRGRILKQTEKLSVTDDDIIGINEDIYVEFNSNDLQSLISTPVILIIFVEEIIDETEDESSINIEITENVYGRKMKEASTQTTKTPQIFGSCLIDLLPMITGQKNCKQFLEIHSNEDYNFEQQSGVNIEISIDDSVQFPSMSNILTLTVESIFNLPETMCGQFEYQICVKLPFTNSIPTIFKSCNYKQGKVVDDFKKWLNFNEVYVPNITKYKVNSDVSDIKNDVNVDLNRIFESENPRIEFNFIQRYFLLNQDFLEFTASIENYPALCLEIFCITDNDDDTLHLMSTIDLSSLLNPGVRNTRVAAPLYNFNVQESKNSSNYEESRFLQPQKPESDVNIKQNNKSLIDDLGEALELAETTNEIDEILYNKDGQPTFIIIEIGLTRPIHERGIEDLTRELRLKCFDENSKQQLINEILKDIINEIIGKYDDYLRQRRRCICSEKSDFLTYLRRIGCYQDFVYLLTQIIFLIIQSNTRNFDGNSQLFHQFGEQIFCEIIKEFNFIINKRDSISKICYDPMLSYAQEAIALQNDELAAKYLLEIIVLNENDPNSWLICGIYQISCCGSEKAYTCVEKALNLNNQHRLSLLLKGILLCDKKQIESAQVCFSSLLETEPHWVEGWSVFCLFHQKNGNTELMELCKQHAEEYLDYPPVNEDFLERDDLIWTKTIIPDSPFLRTSILLIKLNMFSWAEDALTLELQHNDAAHYLLGVICYFKQQYSDAIQHLEQSLAFYETHYAILSLIGHCYYHLENYEEAQKYYQSVLELEEESNMTHLIYLNYAKIYENLQELSKARKMLLLACKTRPTAYTWLTLGKLYYSQNDPISAEECFSESLMFDNRLSETWTYLNLINLTMCRKKEAEICQQFAVMNNLIQQESSKTEGDD